MKVNTGKRTMKAPQVAALLGVDPKTVRARARANTLGIKCQLLGSKLVFLTDDVRRAIPWAFEQDAQQAKG